MIKAMHLSNENEEKYRRQTHVAHYNFIFWDGSLTILIYIWIPNIPKMKSLKICKWKWKFIHWSATHRYDHKKQSSLVSKNNKNLLTKNSQVTSLRVWSSWPDYGQCECMSIHLTTLLRKQTKSKNKTTMANCFVLNVQDQLNAKSSVVLVMTTYDY